MNLAANSKTPGDLTGNRSVGLSDLNLLLSYWDQIASPLTYLNVVLSNWGKSYVTARRESSSESESYSESAEDFSASESFSESLSASESTSQSESI